VSPFVPAIATCAPTASKDCDVEDPKDLRRFEVAFSAEVLALVRACRRGRVDASVAAATARLSLRFPLHHDKR